MIRPSSMGILGGRKRLAFEPKLTRPPEDFIIILATVLRGIPYTEIISCYLCIQNENRVGPYERNGYRRHRNDTIILYYYIFIV